jgi:hypothetical protein
MTKEKFQFENSLQNHLINEKLDPVKFRRDSINFTASLKILDLSIEKLLGKININTEQLKKLQNKFKGEGILWSLKDAQEYLPIIIFLATFSKTQYVEFQNYIVKISKLENEPVKVP